MKSFTLVAMVLLAAVVLVSGCTYPSTTGGAIGNTNTNPPTSTGQVKEFSFDSFFVMEDGKPKPQFSVKEITVNKGDRIMFNVNVTSGAHDFNIDEFNIHQPTQTGQVAVVEFVADKAGEFVYYCNMPGHRANGHWGTLKVLEA